GAPELAQDADPPGGRGALRRQGRARQRDQGSGQAEAARRVPRHPPRVEEGCRAAARRRHDRDLPGSADLVAPLATLSGARRTITLRHAASSVSPGPTGPNETCVLAWLGASAPGTHSRHEETH